MKKKEVFEKFPNTYINMELKEIDADYVIV